MLGVENLNNKTAVNWKFHYCSARASLKIWWIFPHDLIIWWKRKTFIYFIKYYWNLLYIVIQNKKYSIVFHKHGINSLHVYYLISCVMFALFILFLSLCKIEYFGTLVIISFNMFEIFFLWFAFFKSFKNLVMCFVFSLKDISSLKIYRISIKKRLNYSSLYISLVLPNRQFNNLAPYICNEHVLSSRINDHSCIFSILYF